jgi:Cu(I)/Ag(I) efflux system membrane fusion protein
MDQLTPYHMADTRKRAGTGVRFAVWMIGLAFVAALLVGALLLGLRAGQARSPLPVWLPSVVSALLVRPVAAPARSGPVLYYRDPDGKPLYSSESKKTVDGRDFVPVRMGGDLGFEESAKEVAAEPQSTMPDSSGQTILYYRNPMGLPDTSPVPKKDSMGMDYIPVFKGEAEEGNTVKISPGKIQRTGVRSEIIERRVVSRPVRVPGTVQLDERRVAVVATRSDAFVDKVENVTTGDRVRKGQPLVKVYSPEINAAAAQLVSAPVDGSRRRLQNLNVPAEVIAEIERTRTVPMAITWSAPHDGLILERNAVEGMKASAGDVLFRIGDVSVIWVLADVPEYDLGNVKIGQSASVRVRSLLGRTFIGKINLIYPQVNKETRTTRVRVELPNPDSVLLPDMYADVEIATGSTKPVTAVPDDSVIDTGAKKVVLVDKGEGRFEPREVKTGARGNGYLEILDGVREGERVVVSANFLIDAESNLKSALQGMATSAPAGAAEEKPQ